MAQGSIWKNPVVITAVIIGGGVVIGLLSMSWLPNEQLKTQATPPDESSGLVLPPGMPPRLTTPYHTTEEARKEMGDAGCTKARPKIEQMINYYEQIKHNIALRRLQLERQRREFQARKPPKWQTWPLPPYRPLSFWELDNVVRGIDRELATLNRSFEEARAFEAEWRVVLRDCNAAVPAPRPGLPDTPRRACASIVPRPDTGEGCAGADPGSCAGGTICRAVSTNDGWKCQCTNP